MACESSSRRAKSCDSRGPDAGKLGGVQLGVGAADRTIVIDRDIDHEAQRPAGLLPLEGMQLSGRNVDDGARSRWHTDSIDLLPAAAAEVDQDLSVVLMPVGFWLRFRGVAVQPQAADTQARDAQVDVFE